MGLERFSLTSRSSQVQSNALAYWAQREDPWTKFIWQDWTWVKLHACMQCSIANLNLAQMSIIENSVVGECYTTLDEHTHMYILGLVLKFIIILLIYFMLITCKKAFSIM